MRAATRATGDPAGQQEGAGGPRGACARAALRATAPMRPRTAARARASGAAMECARRSWACSSGHSADAAASGAGSRCGNTACAGCRPTSVAATPSGDGSSPGARSDAEADGSTGPCPGPLAATKASSANNAAQHADASSSDRLRHAAPRPEAEPATAGRTLGVSQRWTRRNGCMQTRGPLDEAVDATPRAYEGRTRGQRGRDHPGHGTARWRRPAPPRTIAP